MKVKESSRGEGNLQLNSHVSLGEEDIRISKRESSLNLKKTPATPNRVSVNGLKQSQDIMKPRENSYKVIEDEEAVDKTVKNDIKVEVKPIQVTRNSSIKNNSRGNSKFESIQDSHIPSPSEKK